MMRTLQGVHPHGGDQQLRCPHRPETGGGRPGAIAAQARAEIFPQLGYIGSVARGQKRLQRDAGGQPGPRSDTFCAAGTASWEIDLWGRIRRLNESARAQYLASEEARRDVTISVISQAATAYFQLLALDRELKSPGKPPIRSAKASRFSTNGCRAAWRRSWSPRRPRR